jgi:hypothetical protein
MAQSAGSNRPQTLEPPTRVALLERDSPVEDQHSAATSEPASAATPSSADFSVTSASKAHDFRLHLPHGCEKELADTDICEGEATLSVYPKGRTKEKQVLSFANVSVVRLAADELLVNSAELGDYQSSLVLSDFNFDGHEDLAVQVGQDGPYGGATFQVFLYQPRQGKFKLSESLSALTKENLGLFQRDEARKRIATFTKSGCCYHVTQEYEFVGSNPVVVTRYIEDATQPEGFVTETFERLVKGRWVRTVHREPLSESGDDW